MINTISIVIPTFQRCHIVYESVLHLDAIKSSVPLEIVIVVDGSTDGTFEKLSSVKIRWTTRVLFHENRGLAATRNRGAEESTGDIIIFIDDDMRAAPDFVDAHICAYNQGADAVVGRMTLDKNSPDTILSDQVKAWSNNLAIELADKPTIDNGENIFGGHLSIRRKLFEDLRGFEESYNRDGRYGNEDLDFGNRLIQSGSKVVFSYKAVTAQYYSVTASERIDQWQQLASADEDLIGATGDTNSEVRRRQNAFTIKRPLLKWLILRHPRLVATLFFIPRTIVCQLIDRGIKNEIIYRIFMKIQFVYYTLGRKKLGSED